MDLFPHQYEGVKWMLAREKCATGGGGFLCDEMGLGKTIQMLELLVQNPKKRTLIVVPKSIVSQWKSEITKCIPFFDACIYDGPKRVFRPECDVCVCPYSVLVDLIEYDWDRVILDEGHEIRNRNSLVYKTAIQIKAPLRWIVTGTPVFNKLSDFRSLCTFIGLPPKAIQQDSDAVRDTYVLRRIKKDMVPLTFHNIELEMYDSERNLYERVYDARDEYECILEWILRCRQVCAWPPMVYPDDTRAHKSAKMDTLITMIRSHPSEKSLVFVQFIEESREIQRRLTSAGIDSFVLNGHTKDRESVINGFRNNSSSSAVFIIQIKAGGVGLNLQEATRVYIMQPAWNPATELQAIARSHRTGQTKPVVVKKLVYSECDSIDVELTELQQLKSEMCAQVLGDESLKSQIPSLRETISNFIVKLGKTTTDKNEESVSTFTQKKRRTKTSPGHNQEESA